MKELSTEKCKIPKISLNSHKMLKNDESTVISNQLVKYKSKKSQKTANLANISVFKFIDPINEYRLHGDMVFTDKLWKFNDEEPIYSFELYRNYKKLREIHLREHGIILELEDYDENMLNSTSLIKSRLNSLGNGELHKFTYILDQYENYFLKENMNYSSKKLEKDQNLKVFGWIDQIFQKHTNDVVFMRVNQMINKNDFRVKYLCYSKKLVDWISNDREYFSEEFINSCMKLFIFKNFEEYTNILKSIIIQQVEKETKSKLLPKFLNTLAGNIQVMVNIDTFFMPEENIFIHYIIHSEKDYDKGFIEKMNYIKKCENEEYLRIFKNIGRKKTENYSKVIKIYYQK